MVRAAGIGGVFLSWDIHVLRGVLERFASHEWLTTSKQLLLSTWASCFSADYLLRIFWHFQREGDRPEPPLDAGPISW